MIYKVENLKFSYNKNHVVLNDINLQLNEGELLCVLGKNGSGKSTLFKCLLGLLKKDAGFIKLNGKEIDEIKEKDKAKLIGYVSQSNESTFDFTVFEYVLMGRASNVGLFSHPTKEDENKVLEVLEKMNIVEYKDKHFNELSGGERQQVSIARALVSNPKVLLFDEPTAHLDYSNQMKVLRMIKDLSNKGYAIIITTHDPNHAIMLNGKVALFNSNGSIKTGTVDELIKEEILRDIYGTDLKIRYIEEFKRNVCIYQM